MDRITGSKHETLLNRYLELPARLEAAVLGLSEQQLGLTLGTGWSIRAYVHHTVDGEQMWQMALRAIIGRDGVEFPVHWYFAISQDEWAKYWAYDKRPIEPALALFRGSTTGLVDLMHCLPVETWDHYGRVTWPGDTSESRLTVRGIILIHIRHMDQHTTDIRAIRTKHGC